jgi:hypothetical protein
MLVKSFMTPLWWIIIGGISGVELTPNIIHSSVLTHLENTNIVSDEQHASTREDHAIPN